MSGIRKPDASRGKTGWVAARILVGTGFALVLWLLAALNAGATADDVLEAPGFSSQLFDDPNAPIMGNAQGRDIVVEFFDYRCPYCRAMEPELKALVEKDAQARVILKEWPILGGVSIYAARVALAANWQGKFREVHDALLTGAGPLDRTLVRQIAKTAGVDLGRLDHDMEARRVEIDRMLNQVQDQASALGFKGTPGLVIGKRVISGALSFDDIMALVTQSHEVSAGDPR